ncbi:MAG: hypothetical protein U0325_18430 [Polyangiales bacterium]
MILGLALGCTPRAGGGGGVFVDPDAAMDDVALGRDVVAPEGDAPTTDAPLGVDVVAPDDAPSAADAPPSPCTGDMACGDGRFCEQGMCRPQVCAPGTATCANATTISNCDPRGANRVEMACPGGAACTDGRCQSPRVCEPGASTCEGTSARRVCTPDGTATMTVSCAAGERCTGGACVATQICVPGSTSCGTDGQRRVCNNAGTGYTSMPCGSAPNATVQCVDGQCVTSCAAGFGNCNNNAGDGCEVSLLSTPANCGMCGIACSAGQSCNAGACTGGGGGGDFRITALRTTGCATLEHGTSTGDDRGPLAALAGYLMVTGDTASASINTTTQGVVAVPRMIDWISSNVRTGELIAFSVGPTPLPAGTGGTATHVIVVNPGTGSPTGTPIALSQSIRIAPGAGFFAGWDRVVVWDGTSLFDINLASGAVRALGAFTMPTFSPCELGGLWGVAETEGAETNLVFVANPSTVARVRVSNRAVTTAASFTNLGDMCALSVLPSSNRWYFHHEGPSQFRAGSPDEVAGWCDATTSNDSAVTCTAPEQRCGDACANTQTSPAHCGRCNNACPTGQVCRAGACQPGLAGYTRSSPIVAWVDACALPGVTRIFSTSQDDASQSFPLGFDNFVYWGRRVATVNVATNGFINVDGTALSGTGGSLPFADGSNAVIAPWWVDLRVPASGLCVAYAGSVGSRSFIVQWNNVTYYATSSAVLSFQVRLNEAGNTIDFLYNTMGPAPATNYPAVGIENWDSTAADVVCGGVNAMSSCTAVTNGTRYRFTPN